MVVFEMPLDELRQRHLAGDIGALSIPTEEAELQHQPPADHLLRFVRDSSAMISASRARVSGRISWDGYTS